MKKSYLLVNFGGPRDLSEIEPFLKSLLTDRDVIRTKLPPVVQQWLFSYIAKKRAKKICHDYELIGGKSPIYEDTEMLAQALEKKLAAPVLTFHRYLPSTHEEALHKLCMLKDSEIHVFPLFPQFTYATTGSIARFLDKKLPKEVSLQLKWVKSYAHLVAFVETSQRLIREFLAQNHLKQEETVLIFSCHGIPLKFMQTGDIYEYECQISFKKISDCFPRAVSLLCYQSKFGRGEWLKPYTQDICENIKSYSKERKNVVIYPLSFTSDHIETLFEIEQQYMPLIRQKGLNVFRVPALNLRDDWIEAVVQILEDSDRLNTSMLIRK